MKTLNNLAFAALLAISSVASALAQVAYTTNPPPVIVYQPKNELFITATGNDSTAFKGSLSHSWGTLSNALAAAAPGDRVTFLAGAYTNVVGASYVIPAGVGLAGAGTNSTFLYHNRLILTASNEIFNFTITVTNPALVTILAGTNGYVHDMVIYSSNACVQGGANRGCNVYSNCLFATSRNGILYDNTNYFYNCNLLKYTNTTSTGTKLLAPEAGQFTASAFWSGGSIVSLTNSTGSPTNNFAVWNASTGDGSIIQLQNVSISTPAGGWDIYGDTGLTNFTSGVTFDNTKTNSAAIIVAFGGFSNTNSLTALWQALWIVPNTNSPPVLSNFWLH